MPLLQAVVPLAEKRPMEGYSEPSIPLLQLSFRVSNSQARDLVVKHIAVTSSPGSAAGRSSRAVAGMASAPFESPHWGPGGGGGGGVEDAEPESLPLSGCHSAPSERGTRTRTPSPNPGGRGSHVFPAGRCPCAHPSKCSVAARNGRTNHIRNRHGKHQAASFLSSRAEL